MLEAFFRDIDDIWKAIGKEPICLRVVGSTALFLQSSYRRGTKDSDILEINDLPHGVNEELRRLAGKDSRIARRHRLYLDMVKGAILFVPVKPMFHVQSELNRHLRHFRLEALDITDVVVSKLKRFSAPDIDDIRQMVDLHLLDHTKLIARFHLALDRWLLDARAEELPRYIEHLHLVERDFLEVAETPIELPDWLSR